MYECLWVWVPVLRVSAFPWVVVSKTCFLVQCTASACSLEVFASLLTTLHMRCNKRLLFYVCCFDFDTPPSPIPHPSSPRLPLKLHLCGLLLPCCVHFCSTLGFAIEVCKQLYTCCIYNSWFCYMNRLIPGTHGERSPWEILLLLESTSETSILSLKALSDRRGTQTA